MPWATAGASWWAPRRRPTSLPSCAMSGERWTAIWHHDRENVFNCGADPPVRGRRPPRPPPAPFNADIVVRAAGRGRPGPEGTPTRGSAPQFVQAGGLNHPMPSHRVQFSPSGRATLAAEGASILRAAESAGEPVSAECGGRGACGRCLVRILQGQVPEYRVLRRESGFPDVLACLTPVHGPLTVQPLVEAQLPKLVSADRYVGVAPLAAWAPWPLALAPLLECREPQDLGVALDIGTTTLRLLLIRLSDGAIVGEAGAYNPQIPRGADVISRIVAAEKGGLPELASAIRRAVVSMIDEAAGDLDAANIQGYVVAGNVTMIHLLLGEDPSGIRRVPSLPRALSFSPVNAADLGWPGRTAAPVYTVPGAGGWVGGDILAGSVRAGFSRGVVAGLYR